MRPMSQVIPWFERKFDFTFPLELCPNLCIRLRGTPARLEEILRDASRDVLLEKTGNKWSAQEHAGHLLDLESLWMARVEAHLSVRDALTSGALSTRKTPEASHNTRRLPDLLDEFRAARRRLVDRVGNLSPALFGRSLLHPRLEQPMRLVDHLH